jgi:uncharacterized protein (TIGR00369 family)
MIERLQQQLAEVAAPLVRGLEMKVTAAQPGEVRFTLPVTPHVVHGGGVLCGQAIMAAADIAMVVALTSLEPDARFRPMTTVQLATSFLRPVPATAHEVTLVGRVLRQGRQLSYGEVEFISAADGKLVAHATTTYAYL